MSKEHIGRQERIMTVVVCTVGGIRRLTQFPPVVFAPQSEISHHTSTTNRGKKLKRKRYRFRCLFLSPLSLTSKTERETFLLLIPLSLRGGLSSYLGPPNVKLKRKTTIFESFA